MVSAITVIIQLFILAGLRGGGVETPENQLTLLVDCACMTVFAIALVYDVQNSGRLRKYTGLIISGFLFRIFLLFFDLYGQSIFILPNSGADSESFYRNAISIAVNGVGRDSAFNLLMGTVFRFIGTSRMYGQFIVILFSMVSLCTFARIVDEIDVDIWTKKRAIGVVSLLPNFAILSSIFLRESLVTMFITVSLYFFFRWFQGGSLLSFILAFITCFMAAMYHSGSVGCVAGYIVVMMLYNKRTKSFQFTGKGVLLSLVFILVFTFLFLNYGEVLFGKMMGVDSLEDVGNTRAAGRTSYAQYVGDSSNPIRMAIFTPLRFFFFLFSPLPWMWGGVGDIIAFVFSSLFYFFSIWKAIKSLPYQSRTNKATLIAFIIVAACVVFVFAWGVSNGGTAARHRDKLACLFGLIYLFGADKTNNQTIRFGDKRLI